MFQKINSTWDVFPYLMRFTAGEQICRQRYFLLDQPRKLQKFIEHLPWSQIEKYLLPIPEKLINRFYLVDNHVFQKEALNFAQADHDLRIEKHSRYIPAFWHFHTFFEIVYVYSGTGQQYINGQTVQLSAGDLLIVPPMMMHAIEANSDHSLIINLHLQAKSFQNVFFSLLQNYGVISRFFNHALNGDSSNSWLLFHTHADPQIRRIIDQLIIEYHNQDDYAYEIMIAEVKILMAILIRNFKDDLQINTLGKPFSKRIFEIISCLQNEFATIDLQELAQRFHYSSVYLSRLIKQQTGLTFSQLITQQRIQQAQYLLTNTNDKIEQIAETVGFQNSSHFIRAFKREVKTTPSKYRNKHAKINSL